MSRQDGPVRQSGMPPGQPGGAPETSADPFQDPFAQHNTQQHNNGAPTHPAPHQPQAPHQDAQYTGTNGAQNAGQFGGGYAYSQDPQQPGYPGAPSYATPPNPQNQTYSPQPGDPSTGVGTSWADVNQPMPAQNAPQQPRYAETASYEPAAASPAYANPHGFDGGAPNTVYGQHSQPYQEPAPQVAATTPSAAPSGYEFSNFDGGQPSTAYPASHVPGQDPQLDWGQAGYAPAAVPTTDLNGTHDHVAGQALAHDDAYAHAEDDYDDDHEAQPRGRKVFIAAALAGAIVVGGSVAYGYQALFGAAPSDKPPVVRGATGPSKVKPADPGGRKFAHADSKIMGRLGAASGATNDPSSGARRVSTLRIGRDGSIVTPATPTAGPGGSRMVSGMPLGGTAATAGSQAKPAQANPGGSPLVVKPPANSATPVNVAAVPRAQPKPPVKKPVVVNSTPVKKPAAATTKAVAKPKPKPAPKKVAAAQPVTPVATGPKPTGAGYVAVLASVPASKNSRMAALKQFADLQQKYGTALANKTPDVQRADLGAKGTYHRLIAGPPGSVQSARSVCDALKSSGYTSCWVLAY